jgi:RHH-type rel operon transcriptional repressor/antitoxin RelB
MNISVRMSEDESLLLRKYARMNNISLSELIRQSVFERIENEHDLKAYETAMEEYRKDATTYTLDEVEKELSLK